MPKYLVQVSYTADATKALVKGGGTKRRTEVEEFVRSAGGRLEALYFAFGEIDVYAVVELPDAATAAAMSMAANGSGAVRLWMTVLLTPEELDQATKKSVNYRPPGA
jgi:uncharacterized protein with GYD domain